MAAKAQEQSPNRLKKAQDFGVQYAIYLVFVVLILVIAVKEPAFLSLNNFRNILTMSATRIIIAMGMGAILITGGVDLSAGRQVGLAAVLSASMLQNLDYPRRMYPDMPILPLLIPILVAMLACGIFGFLNGFFIAKLKLPAFIATLGSMVAVYGVNSLYFDRPPYGAQPIGGLDRRFSTLGSGYIGVNGLYSIPYIVIIAVVITLITYVLFNKTTYGKNIYAIGGNAEAAKVSGVNVNRTLILVYTIAGVLFGLGGTLEAARTGGATNNYGNGYELDAIAACVVGGVSNLGGIGTVPGIVIGVLIFSVINYGLTFINMSPYWQQIVKGAIIIAAVALDIRKYLKKR
ncbi:galactoside transport system permease protein MglC [Treponema primitia ZAS-2]|uniref:Galactoside transport system permease protein MglC n=1 Tax=Treponema primitia (strain ATCC BAA-887 / DSM 12427 / ZAS-2) TaxID=545694 RepID=F5YJF9_TREPZ|nr:galactose/methyl galactoside ABC transporter permease MglC [Treponema primitia]AEF84760.1 galactoside transport system permease protein MglC [Treponema primitia ZAS-2]